MLKSFGSREENEGVYAFRISKRRLEVNELTQIVLGTIPNYIYTASVTLFSISSMWFYGVIFSLSFTQTLPLPFYKDTYHVWHHGSSCNFNEGLGQVAPGCRETYTIYLGFFVLLTMFAASFDLADQKSCKLFSLFCHDMRFMYVGNTRSSNGCTHTRVWIRRTILERITYHPSQNPGKDLLRIARKSFLV